PESYSSKYQDLYNRLKGRDIMFSIGSDSHEIESLSNIEIPLRMLEFYELQNNYLRFVNNLEKFFLKQK
ncbi:MAG: hypothetical protein ACFFKA_15160, partial [Candidatus Thorarchaeota archaeon]